MLNPLRDDGLSPLEKRRAAALQRASDDFRVAKRDAGPLVERLGAMLEQVLEQQRKILALLESGASGAAPKFDITSRDAAGKVKSFEVSAP